MTELVAKPRNATDNHTRTIQNQRPNHMKQTQNLQPSPINETESTLQQTPTK